MGRPHANRALGVPSRDLTQVEWAQGLVWRNIKHNYNSAKQGEGQEKGGLWVQLGSSPTALTQEQFGEEPQGLMAILRTPFVFLFV